MPTIKDFIEYLMDNNFQEDQTICFLVGDLKKRVVWHPENFIGVTDAEEGPMVLLEISGEGESMDADIEDEIEGLDLEDQLEALLDAGDQQLDALAKSIE